MSSLQTDKKAYLILSELNKYFQGTAQDRTELIDALIKLLSVERDYYKMLE